MAGRVRYTTVIGRGDLMASLCATRDRIAADIESCESMRDKAALYARMADVLARIEAARPVDKQGDVVDEIAARRAARGAVAAKGAPRAKRQG